MDGLDKALDDTYLVGLQTRPLDDIRGMRRECEELEASLSYARRMVQGRLDIVRSEHIRRGQGAPVGDLDGIISRLPDILGAEKRNPDPSRKGRVRDVTPSNIDMSLVEGLDRIAGADTLGKVDELDAEQLEQIELRLTEYEELISTDRSLIHKRIDALRDEITRRYQTGEATVDALLR